METHERKKNSMRMFLMLMWIGVFCSIHVFALRLLFFCLSPRSVAMHFSCFFYFYYYFKYTTFHIVCWSNEEMSCLNWREKSAAAVFSVINTKCICRYTALSAQSHRYRRDGHTHRWSWRQKNDMPRSVVAMGNKLNKWCPSPLWWRWK